MVQSRRNEAVKFADAVNATEGVPVRRYAIDLSVLWAAGKISSEQMRKSLVMSHKQLALQMKKHNG